MNVAKRREEVTLKLRKDKLQGAMMQRRFGNLGSEVTDGQNYELNDLNIPSDSGLLETYSAEVIFR